MSGGVVGNLQWLDVVAIVVYFVLVLGVGLWSSRRNRQDSMMGYFLAGRNANWIIVGASLFASNIGSTHFIGLAGAASASGIGIAGFELNASFILLLLGWLFVPVYIAGQVYTMPEYLRKRFGGNRIRVYLSVMSLILYVFIRISADLYAGAIFIRLSLKWDLYPAVLSLLLVAAFFTVVGGLTAVMWTDFLQTILILAGATAIAVLSFIKVGGYAKLVEDFYSKHPNGSYVGYDHNNESCSKVTRYYMNLLRPASDPDFPWTGMTIGLSIAAVWSWCSDQVLVQRTLAAKNLSHAKGGCILAGYLKMLPLFLMVFPGMAARVLFTDVVGCSNPEACEEVCGNPNGCTNSAYPLLVMHLLPPGAMGLMVSVMLAAVMTSLTSVFNSSATLFSIDVWSFFRKNASETELLVVGRIFVVALVAISVAWIPIIEEAQHSQLFHYTQSVISYLAPPICAVYILAILWERTNEKGAFWGLMVGLVVGLSRFGAEFSYSVPPCSSGLPDPRPSIIAKVHYLHFCCILFAIVCIVTVVMSILTEPIARHHLYRLTYWTVNSAEQREDLTTDLKQQEPTQRPFPPPIRSVSRGKPGIWQKAANFFCGISEDGSAKPTDPVTAEQEVARALTYVRETPVWKYTCAVHAVLLTAVSTFIWSFYG